MRAYVFPLTVCLLISCTASHEKLESYVGLDIQEVVTDFGNPDVAFDMGNGRRDFMWTMRQSSSMPAYDISPGALTNPADQFNPDIKGNTEMPRYGGQAIAAECSYIMITNWDIDKKTWVVNDYQRPGSGC